MKKENETDKKLLLGAGLFTAFIASLCCFGPLLVTVLGIGSAGLFAKFEPFRPYFLAITIGLWGYGLYYLYFKKENCTDEKKCSTDMMSKKRWFWIITVIITIILTFPNWIGLFL